MLAGTRVVPVARHVCVVRDHLAVGGPGGDDPLAGAYAGTTRITGRTEVVPLRCTGGAGTEPSVGGAVDRPREDVGDEGGVVADNGRRQVMVHALQDDLEHGHILLAVDHDDLEGPEQLRGQELEVGQEMTERDLDSRGFEGPVLLGDVVVLERLAAAHETRARDREDLADVRLDLLVVPGEDRTDGEVLQAAPLGQEGELRQKTLSDPVLVDKQDALGRALLPAPSVGILVALPRHVAHQGLGVARMKGVGTKDLPVEPGVLDLDTPTHSLRDGVRGTARAGELNETDHVLGLLEELGRGLAGGTHEVDVSHRQAAVVKETDELLHHDGHTRVRLDQGLVAHEERPHGLEDRDLDREVERRDDHDRPVGPAVASRFLTEVVARRRSPVEEVADVVAGERRKEVTDDLHLADGLRLAHGHDPLDEPDEEPKGFIVAQRLRNGAANVPKHPQTLEVAQGVVKPRLGDSAERLDERSELVRCRRRHVEGDVGLVHGVDDVTHLEGTDPTAGDQVLDVTHEGTVWLGGGEFRNHVRTPFLVCVFDYQGYFLGLYPFF